MVNEWAAELASRPGQVTVPAELRAYISSHGFWKWGTTAMFEIIISNLAVGLYLRMTPKKALAKAEKDKKSLSFQACLERRPNFTTMIYSADRIPGEEALDTQKRLVALLKFKMKREHSELCGFVKARVYLGMVRSNSLILCDPGDKEVHI